MKDYQSLNHTKWECKYHFIFIPKRRRQAEFLIYGSFPWELIHELAVMTKRAKNAAEKILTEFGIRMDVNIRPQWYF